VRALVAWALAATRFLASRFVSIIALAGGIGLGFYVAWRDNWVGVACFGVYAIILIACLRSEDRGREAINRGP
jgi:amino acid permease